MKVWVFHVFNQGIHGSEDNSGYDQWIDQFGETFSKVFHMF